MNREAAANVNPVRQRTQYTCMATSLMMCLRAHDIDVDEELVNDVMGARAMQGASWEQMFAAAQHFGQRVTFICPATVRQLKEYTDRGIPLVIAWNPEGRPWGHASVVFDVDDDLNVHVADPNIPDPDETVRIVPKAEFYGKWYEKYNEYLVRRPACAIEPEITLDGRQRVASQKRAKVDEDLINRAAQVLQYYDERKAIKHLIDEGLSRQDAYLAVKAAKKLNEYRSKGRRGGDECKDTSLKLAAGTVVLQGYGKDYYTDNEWLVEKVRRKKGDEWWADNLFRDRSRWGPFTSLGEAVKEVEKRSRKRVKIKKASYSGNPDGNRIYPGEEFDHGYGEPLAGGTDVMRQLQNRLRKEQGREPRPDSPKVGAERVAERYLRRGIK